MDFDIKELSLTLVCGLYAVVLVGLGIAYMHPKLSVRDALRAPFLTANLDASVFSLLAMFAILMSIGICAEDLSQNAVAGRGPGFFDQPLREILPSEASLRLGVMFDAEGQQSVADVCETLATPDFPKDGEQRFSLSPLGAKYFAAVDPARLPPAGAVVLSCNALKDHYYPAYYSAKNRVYRQDNYYAELKAIQARGAFGRTMAYISTIGLISLAIAVCCTEVLTRIARVVKPRHRRPRLLTIGAIGATSMAFIGFLAIPYEDAKWLWIKFLVTCGFLGLALLILLARVLLSKQRREFCGLALLMAAAVVPFRYMYITEYVSYANRVFGYSESLEIAHPQAKKPADPQPAVAPTGSPNPTQDTSLKPMSDQLIQPTG